MSLNVLLQILRAFECLPAEVALMRLQRNVNTDVRCDVVTLYSRSAAITPLTSQVQVVSALATDMAFANVILIEVQYLCNNQRRTWTYVKLLSRWQTLAAGLPLAGELVAA